MLLCFIQSSPVGSSRNESPPLVADPLPQGVPLKPLVGELKKEVHHLRKKLKKTEDALRASRKNASEANKEVTKSRAAHNKTAVRLALVKGNLDTELAKLRQSSNDQAQEAAARITALETDLREAREKIQVLEGGPSWEVRQAQREQDWLAKLSEAQKRLKDAEANYDSYSLQWRKRVSSLEQKLKAAEVEIARLQHRLMEVAHTGTSREAEEILSLRRTVGELSDFLSTEKAEVQRLKLQLAQEQQAVKDAEAESEVMRKWRRESEAKFNQINRLYVDGLLKKKDLEEEIVKLKRALVEATEESLKSEEETGPS